MSQPPFKASKLAIARCERDGDHWKLEFVRELASSLEAVWDVLTEPDELKAWAPYTADRNLGQTGPVKLIMIDREPPEELPSMVSIAERPRLLKHSWGQHGELRWMLEAAGIGTRLTLHHTLEQAELAPRMAAGWHLCLDVAEHFLAGNPIKPIRGMDALNYGWAELQQSYSDRLGIASSPPSQA
jgi:uncharacterized protein YndB with AHSA1/START domain